MLKQVDDLIGPNTVRKRFLERSHCLRPEFLLFLKRLVQDYALPRFLVVQYSILVSSS